MYWFTQILLHCHNLSLAAIFNRSITLNKLTEDNNNNMLSGARRFNRVIRHMSQAKRHFSAKEGPAILNGELIVEANTNGLVHFKLNRPDRFNALSLSQVQTIGPYIKELAKDAENCKAILMTGEGPKAFCAGGDIRKMMEEGDSGWNLQFFASEYMTDHAISKFPRPYISLWHGIVMGGGVGVSVHGTYRVACEKTVFAMPECGIGLMPDVGGSYILPRLGGKDYPGIGMYAGLTGHRFNGRDCVRFGMATHFVPLEMFESLTNALKMEDLQHPDDVKKILDRFHVEPTQDSSLNDDDLSFIAATFGSDTADPDNLKNLNILADNVKNGNGKAADFCKKAFAKNCPMSMAVTMEALQRGKSYTLKQALEQEFNLAGYMTHTEPWNFKEGVRTTLFDKEDKPQWRPATIDAVKKDDVDRHFAGPPGESFNI